jgi:hypothetical protein
MHVIRKIHLSRRALLRGAGGVAVALPLLEAMIPAATALAKTAGKPKPRFGAIYVPHGATMAKWTPDKVGTDFKITEILEPLEPYRDRLNIISGLGLPMAYGQDGSAGANHTRSSATFLTCAHPGTEAQARLGVSVDQVAARAIGQDTPLPSIELTIEESSLSCGAGLSCAYRNTISWQSDTSPLPMENNPQVLFERLFGDGATDAERAARRAQSKSLLDSAMAEAASLQRDLPSSDRTRLDEYLTDIREIERRIQLAGQTPDGLKLPEAPVGIPDDFEAHIKLMFDLQVLAWQAEVTRISTLMLAHEVSNATYPKSGVRDPFHNLSHHSNVQANKDRFAVLNRYHVTQLAYFLEKLKKTPDGEGSLLDNSVVLYGSGISDGNQHDHDPLPIVLAGGAAGQLKGGRHLQFERKTTIANLHTAVLNKLGVPSERFGDSTGILEI